MRSRRLQKFVWPLLALASLLTLFAPESESHAGAFIDPQSTFGEILIPAKRWGANDGADVYSNVDPVTLKPTPWNKYDRMEFGRIYQCMELVTRFFHLQFGHTKSWNVLLAKDTFENHPPGIEAYANGDSASAGPNWGDILVFDASRTYPDGHVAIVYARSRDRVYFVEQNISLDDGTVIGHDSLAIGKDNRIDNKSGLFVQNRPTVKGWLHSTSNSGGQSLDIKPMVPGGVWASPLETVSTTDAALITLSASAYPSDADDPSVAFVNFTAYQPGSANKQWSFACKQKGPQRAGSDAFICAFDPAKLGMKPGEIWVSFDVYDILGQYQLAPHGIHQIFWKVPKCDVICAIGSLLPLPNIVPKTFAAEPAMVPSAGNPDGAGSEPVASSGPGRLRFEVWTCGEGESQMSAWGPFAINDWGVACLASDAPQTLVITSENGDQTEVQVPATTELWLPFGNYHIENLTLGLETTLTLEPNTNCEVSQFCENGWTVGIQVEESNIGTSDTGTVSILLYQCPEEVTAQNASPSSCQQGNTGPLELYFWNYDLGQTMTLADASWDGQSFTWTGLPIGTYILAPEWGPGLFGSIYVPGLESFDSGSATVDWDDTTYPASPDYAVTPLSGTGYWVPVAAGSANVTLEVYAFGPSCLEDPCESTSSQGSAQPVDLGPGDDPLVAEAIRRFGGDWTGIFYQSNPTREWPIRISYWGGPEGTVVGSIEYLPDVCKADLIQLQMVLDFGLSLQEQVTTGRENCISGGTINLDGNGDALTFTWGHPDSDATGHGVLQRLGSSEPLTMGKGSLEIHAVTCPAGFAGPDYFGECHDNGASGLVFLVDSVNMALSITSEVSSSPGPGIARLDGLQPGNYQVFLYDNFASRTFVFCSPDEGDTTLVSQNSAGDPVDVPVYDQAVVCDWYLIP